MSGQSFSLYSISEYQENLTEYQLSRLKDAKWYKDQADKLKKQSENLERKASVKQHESGNSEISGKARKIVMKMEKNEAVRLDYLSQANALYIEVYNEKIDDKKSEARKKKSEAEILKKLEKTADQYARYAKNVRNRMLKASSLEDENKLHEVALDNEKVCIDLYSLTLQGYYILINDPEKEKFIKWQSKNDIENKAIFSEAIAENDSSNNYFFYSDDQYIIITKDAPIVYNDNPEIMQLIIDNYNVDTIENEVYITLPELKKLDSERLILAEAEQNASPDQAIEMDNKITDVNLSNNDLSSSDSELIPESLIETEISENQSKTSIEQIEDSGIGQNQVNNQENIELISEHIETKNILTENLDNNQNTTEIQNVIPSIESKSRTDINNIKRLEPKYDNVIRYRIQIAASRRPLSQGEIDKIYRGNKTVKVFEENGWFKYIVDEIENHNLARKMARETGVKGSFIAAYVNEEKIELYNAIQFTER